jgi:hypothetical protein
MEVKVSVRPKQDSFANLPVEVIGRGLPVKSQQVTLNSYGAELILNIKHDRILYLFLRSAGSNL